MICLVAAMLCLTVQDFAVVGGGFSGEWWIVGFVAVEGPGEETGYVPGLEALEEFSERRIINNYLQFS